MAAINVTDGKVFKLTMNLLPHRANDDQQTT